MELKYQNPASTDAILDSEQVTADSSGNPVQREYVVPQESVSNFDPLGKLVDLTEQVLQELKNIRVLLEQDAVPGVTEDALDEESSSIGVEDALAYGLEEL